MRAKTAPFQIGISSCLAGQKVRYDGNDKNDAFVFALFDQHCAWHPLCPEAGAGLGIPRPPVQLVDVDGTVQAIGVHDPSLNVSAALVSYANSQLSNLAYLDAYVFKARSPSCGVVDTPIRDSASDIRLGAGLFADAVARHYPCLPLIDENRLRSREHCASFIEHLVDYSVWKNLTAQHSPAQALAHFHQQQQTKLHAYDAHTASILCNLVESLAQEHEKSLVLTWIQQYEKTYFNLIQSAPNFEQRLQHSEAVTQALLHNAKALCHD